MSKFSLHNKIDILRFLYGNVLRLFFLIVEACGTNERPICSCRGLINICLNSIPRGGISRETR